MLLFIHRDKATAVAHNSDCKRAEQPFSPESPFCGLGAVGGWFPMVDKAHAEEIVAKWLPSARLVACESCFDSGQLRPLVPGRMQEEWEVEGR